MPFNGTGSFSAPSVAGWPASPGAVISSTAVNTVVNDIVAGLSAVLPRDGQSAMTGALNMGAQKITNVLFSEEAAAPNVASAATVDVGAQPGRTFAITGTTTITSFGVANNGVWKLIRFAGAVPLTHSSNLRLPGAASFTANDGDALLALSLGSGIWEVLAYFRRTVAAGDATTLNGQAGSYYTNITARLGYTPLNKAGDTMTGALVLSGAPTIDLHASTKKYVDDTSTWASISGKGVTEGSISQDPNTTQSHVILSNHANTPDSSNYWHITTTFYSSVTGNRGQIAVQYANGSRVYARSYYEGVGWQAWTRCDLKEAQTNSVSTEGYATIPGASGLTFQWGYAAGHITFPVTFTVGPVNFIVAIASDYVSNFAPIHTHIASISTSGLTRSNTTFPVRWFAMGTV